MTAAETLLAWRRDPVRFVREVFNVEPDAWQAEMLNECGRPGRKRIALRACVGPGKTCCIAWEGWRRLLCYGGKGTHPKGLALSVSADNLKDNLWAELSKWQGRSELLLNLFEWTHTKIYSKQNPETWFLSARSYAKGADAESIGRALSGLHADYPFYLIDESGEIPPQVARAAEQGLSECLDGLILTAGNPTSNTGLLYDVTVRGAGNWVVISITGDPLDPKRSPRVNLEWAKQQIEKYGRDDPWVKSQILGQFPEGNINSLLSAVEVEAAMARKANLDDYQWSQKRLGVDVARFGDDRTCIFPRQGLQAFQPIVMRGQRTTDIAARVAQGIRKWNAEMVFVDDTGHWGHGVIDNLLTARLPAIGIQFHGPATDPRYRNKRAEIWFNMAEWVKRGGCLPRIPELIGELSEPTYSFSQGKIILEDKDQIKKRLGKSPDLADALCLSFSYPDQPAMNSDAAFLESLRKSKDNYDPLAY